MLLLLVIFAHHVLAREPFVDGVVRPRLPGPGSVSHLNCTSDPANSDYFWNYNDWGAVYRHRSTLTEYCQSTAARRTSLKCTANMAYCEARNVIIQISKPEAYSNVKVNPPVLAVSDCQLSSSFPPANRGIHSLTDWYPELSTFSTKTGATPQCDIWIEETVLITRGDIQTNIYNNLCDFVNLYLSMYIGDVQSKSRNDLAVLYWEPEIPHLKKFNTVLESLYKIFTARPLLHLKQYFETNVCFRHAIFSVKPRAVNTFFYNQHVGKNCVANSTSSFLRKFSDSALSAVMGRAYALPTSPKRFKVTFLSRSHGQGRTAGTRHIVNQVEIARAARKRYPHIEFTVENFGFSYNVPFNEQMTRIRHTDVLIGMHGAGLVHMLWLPEWASVYELHTCGSNTYSDLSRMLGLQHIAGGDEDVLEKVVPTQASSPGDVTSAPSPDNPRAWNYRLNVEAFLTHLGDAISHVKSHPAFPGIYKQEEL